MEYGAIDLKPVDCDAVVIAGDVFQGSKGGQWVVDTFKNIPDIYVTGNHEYYGNKLPKVNEKLLELSDQSNFVF